MLLFTALCLSVDGSVWAAPPASKLYQTVPNATATSTNTPVPTATPVSNNDDNDDDGDDDEKDDIPSPTPKPTTPIEQIFETPALGNTADDSTNTDDANNGNTAADKGSDNTGSNNTDGGNTGDSSAEANRENSSVNNGNQDSTPIGQEAPRKAVLGRVSVIVLNVREGPSAQHKVSGTIFSNTQVEVLGRTSDST